MALTTTTNKVIHSGNASATVFPYAFPILSAAHLTVLYTDTDGTVTTLSPSEYSVTGIGGRNGGSVTYTRGGSPIETGTSLTILRTVPLSQTTVLSNQGGYYPEVVERRFDEIYMAMQQIVEKGSRAILFSVSDPIESQADNELPSAERRAGTVLGFDEAGRPIPFVLSGGGVSDAVAVSYTANISGAVSRTARDRLGDVLSIRDFGAKGDGVQDDAPYFQAALNALTGRDAALFFPRGTYKCLSQIVHTTSGAKSVRLLGASLGASVLYWPNGGGIKIQFPTPDSTNMWEQYAEISELALLASATNAGVAVDVSCATEVGDNSPGFYMDNCYVGSDNQEVGNYWTNAVKLSNIRNFGIADNVFNGQVLTTSAAKHIYLTGGTVDGEIRNCGFFNADRGVDIDGNCEGVHIESCSFVYTGRGIRWYSTLPHIGTGATIDNCHFSCLDAGIDISDVAHGSITNCRPFQKREGTGNDYVDINLAKGCYQWEIAGNHFRGAGSGGTTDGIVIGDTGDGSWINVHDNTFEDRRYGVWPKASTSSIFVHDNTIVANVTEFIKDDMTPGNGGVYRNNNAASGLISALELTRTLALNSTTPSVDGSQYGSFFANNSSATTITDLRHGLPGQVIDIRALTGNTTVQHNSRINLQGGVNFAMSTGAILTLKYYAGGSGTWYEQCRRTP